jgi:hypothetical protein
MRVLQTLALPLGHGTVLSPLCSTSIAWRVNYSHEENRDISEGWLVSLVHIAMGILGLNRLFPVRNSGPDRRPRSQIARRHLEFEKRHHLGLDHLTPQVVRFFALAVR